MSAAEAVRQPARMTAITLVFKTTLLYVRWPRQHRGPHRTDFMLRTASFSQTVAANASIIGWALLALAVALPPLATLATGYWGSEQGAAGPIMLASGLWLLQREARGMAIAVVRVPLLHVVPLLLVLGAVDLLGTATGILWAQILATYGFVVTLLAYRIGWPGVARLWAPIAYLAFLTPPPDVIMVPLTHDLKLLVANVSLDVLAAAGYSVARSGVSLYIGQYQVVVAAACSGMNSLLSLTALGLFYVYCLHRANWLQAGVLCALLVPVAIIANIARVIGILLVTYYFGDAVGQSVLHEIAGGFAFVVAMVVLIGLDLVLAPLFAPRRKAST